MEPKEVVAKHPKENTSLLIGYKLSPSLKQQTNQ